MRGLAVLLLVVSLTAAQGQSELPFSKEIRAFRKLDSIQFPASHQILFIGSSSFTMWTDVQKAFPGYPIINRAFGGSTLKDVNFYFNEVVKPYHAKQVVIYCGDNDFANDATLPVDSVVIRFQKLTAKIRTVEPAAKITFVSIKPSPSRKHLMPKIVEANARIKLYLKKENDASFVNVYDKMLDKNGKPLKTIFREDSLHMNAQGYAIWKMAIKPHLLKK